MESKTTYTNYSREDLIREYQFENSRADLYFDKMYQVSQFAAATEAALLVFSLGIKPNENAMTGIIMLGYICPAILYVFGLTFVYNWYSRVICGHRAEMIRYCLYNLNGGNEKPAKSVIDDVMQNYVATAQRVSIMGYSGPFFMYAFLPIALVAMSWCFHFQNICKQRKLLIGVICASILLVVYIITFVLLVKETISKIKDQNKEFRDLKIQFGDKEKLNREEEKPNIEEEKPGEEVKKPSKSKKKPGKKTKKKKL